MTGERRGMERRPSLHNIISCLPSTSGKSNKKCQLIELSRVRHMCRGHACMHACSAHDPPLPRPDDGGNIFGSCECECRCTL